MAVAALLDRFGRAAMRCVPGLGNTDLGRAAESAVASHLAREGWRVVGRRVPEAAAELDVVAWDGPVLVAVEVKASRVPSLSGLRYRPGQRLDGTRLQAQQRAIARLAARLEAAGSGRVDLIEVYVLGPRRKLHLTHLRDRQLPLGWDDSG